MATQYEINQQKKKNRKTGIKFIIITALVVGGYFLISEVLFPMLGGNRTPVEYVAIDDRHIILLTENSKYHPSSKRSDGTYTDSYTEAKGYSIDLIDPVQNKRIDRIDIKLPKRGNRHEHPTIFLGDSNMIYLVFDPKADQKVVQEVRILKITGDKIELKPGADLQGLSFVEFYTKSARLTNSANEQHCMEYATGKISKGNCDPFERLDSAEGKRTGRYFFYYKSAPELFTVYYLKFNPEKIKGRHTRGYEINKKFKPGGNPYLSDWDFEPAKERLKSPEYLQKMDHKTLLRDPKILMETDSTLFMMANGESRSKFYFFNAKKLQWTIDIPMYEGNDNYPPVRILQTANSIIISSQHNWVLSVDRNSGKQNWKYPVTQ